MKAGWKRVAVEDFADLCLGKMLDKARNRGTPRPYLRNLNVRWFDFDLTDVAEMPFEANEVERYSAREGDLLVCEGGYPGRAGIWQGDPIFFQKAIHRVRCHEQARARWLLYFLLMSDMNGSLADHFTGTGIQHFTGQAFRKLMVPLPPLLEQQRAVAILDEAFGDIATATTNAEKNLANVRELFERASAKLLTEEGDCWKEFSFEDVCAISSRLVEPRREEFVDLPHIGAGNMESRTGELSNVLTAREEGLISGKFLFDPTMVLYSKIRPYLMKAARPNFAGLCSADVYPLAPVDGKLERDFLFHILLSSDFTTYAEAGSARAGMPKVNREHLFAYRLKLPPVEKQRELAAKIDALAEGCRDLTNGLDQKLKHLEALKQSLLARAFSGELTREPIAA